MLGAWEWGLAYLSAFLVGLSKTGISGLGILPVAILASILPARESVGVLLVVLIAADIVAVLIYRREASWPHLARLFPWAGAGIIAGAVTLGRIDDLTVRRLIGGILVALVTISLVRRRTRALEEEVERAPRAWLGPATGLLAGFTTMIANAAGPIMALYLLAMRLPKLVFVGTTAWFFLAINLFKVPFSYHLGLISPGSAALSGRLIPFAVLGALSGRWVLQRLNQQAFELLVLLLTLAAGLRLLLG